jgi:hypothetical protein
LVSAVLALVLVAGTVLAGSRYFYCPNMGANQLTSCCPEHQGEGSDAAQIRSSACCESKLVKDLPAAHTDPRPLVAAAALVAILSPLPSSDAPCPPAVKGRRARSGSDPPTPSRARSQLMVFLT